MTWAGDLSAWTAYFLLSVLQPSYKFFELPNILLRNWFSVWVSPSQFWLLVPPNPNWVKKWVAESELWATDLHRNVIHLGWVIWPGSEHPTSAQRWEFGRLWRVNSKLTNSTGLWSGLCNSHLYPKCQISAHLTKWKDIFQVERKRWLAFRDYHLLDLNLGGRTEQGGRSESSHPSGLTEEKGDSSPPPLGARDQLMVHQWAWSRHPWSYPREDGSLVNTEKKRQWKTEATVPIVIWANAGYCQVRFSCKFDSNTL